MLSTVARTVVPALGRLRVTRAPGAELAPGSIVAANHTSLVDPGVVLAALDRLGTRPVVLATAGLWRVPGLRHALVREGHVPVHRGTHRAAASLEGAAAALAAGRIVLLYGEGGLPRRTDAGEAAPGPFRTGLARLALATGAPIVPLGQAGSRRISSGSAVKQVAGFVTAPLRRPDVHVHVGAPIRLSGDIVTATARARRAVVDAWRIAAHQAGHLPHAGGLSGADLDVTA
ncbi:lysophospholipid acyltransferase family protein [Streptomyces megasporus]|uniref:lysophospholipid acyltransferase family protein n=1 Tax=Streptomyces megasporus TaxID=44060 RepID=UPI0006913A8E|nr:lysophospholipid acyltransferase family protein [Streptomyces megasporus]